MIYPPNQNAKLEKGTTMIPIVTINDTAIWFKHIESSDLKKRFESLEDDQPILLETDGVIGSWRRMKTGKDGRPVEGIRPDGNMKEVWKTWYPNRKGEKITIREVQMADEYLVTVASLFPEWDSPEDNEAFRDL
jgi:hypothetical protein